MANEMNGKRTAATTSPTTAAATSMARLASATVAGTPDVDCASHLETRVRSMIVISCMEHPVAGNRGDRYSELERRGSKKHAAFIASSKARFARTWASSALARRGASRAPQHGQTCHMGLLPVPTCLINRGLLMARF